MAHHHERDALQVRLAHATSEERARIVAQFLQAREAEAAEITAIQQQPELRELVMQRSKKSLGRTAGLPLVVDGNETGERLALTVRDGRVELVLIEDRLTDARALYTAIEARSERVLTADPDPVSLDFSIETRGIPRTARVSVARLLEATVRAVVGKLPRVSVRT